MPYTYASLAFVWLVTLGLFAVSASGVVTGSWLIVLVLTAMATPILFLRRAETAALAPQLIPVPVIAGSRRRSRGSDPLR